MTEQNDSTSAGRAGDLTAADVVRKACVAAFGKPLVVNYLRSMLVECMVADALAPQWKHVSADWAGWDFQSVEGIRLEVKQSAAKQSWTKEVRPPIKCAFDIAPRAGYFAGSEWKPAPGRNAEIYILAHHPIIDVSADHREPEQWEFYVVKEIDLVPASQKTIALSCVKRLVSAVGIQGLNRRVYELGVAARFVQNCTLSRSGHERRANIV